MVRPTPPSEPTPPPERNYPHVSGRIDQKRAGSARAATGRDRPSLDRAAAVLAARQHGVVALRQLLALGFSYGLIRVRLERGSLHRLHRGVYAVGHRRLTREGHLLAALYAAGDGAFLSHRTAAGVHGLCALNMYALELTVPSTRARSRSGVRIHCAGSEPPSDEIGTKYGLRVSSVPRTLLELASRSSEAELDRLITVSVRKRVLNHAKLEAALHDHAGRPGVARLRRAYAAYRPRPERNSSLERDFDRLLERHPEIPPPQRNIWLDGWELDYFWPRHRLVLELDGRPYHLAVRDIERDRFRDAKLLRAGIRTLRITDRRYNDDPEGVIDDLHAALRLRAA